MAEKVTPIEPALAWDRESPHAVLITDDFARSVLALNPDPSDADDRAVVLIWESVRFASMGRPGAEAIAGHPLHAAGIGDLAGLDVVEGSALIQNLEQADSAHPFHEPEWYADVRHYVLPLQDATVEVVAAGLSVVRVAGSTTTAATRAEYEAEPDRAGPVSDNA